MKTVEFMKVLQASFKGYNKISEQLESIRKFVDYATDEQRQELIMAIQSGWTIVSSPPTIAHIRKINTDNQIGISPPEKKYHLMWKCGQCGEVYEYVINQCPNLDCGKNTNQLPHICVCGIIFNERNMKCPGCSKPRSPGAIIRRIK